MSSTAANPPSTGCSTMTESGDQLCRLDPSRNMSMPPGAARGKRVQAFGGAKNHMIIMPDADMNKAVDAIMGAAYGPAANAAWRFPSQCQSVTRRPTKSSPRSRPASKHSGSARRPTEAEMVRSSPARHLDKVRAYIDNGVEQGATLAVDGRGFEMQGYENGHFSGHPVRPRHGGDGHLQAKIFGPVLSVVRARTTKRRFSCRPRTPMATAPRSSRATATRRAISRRR